MPESVVSFKSLPPEYQQAIQTVEEKYQIAVSPLQELAGGWSGAGSLSIAAAGGVSTGRGGGSTHFS